MPCSRSGLTALYTEADRICEQGACFPIGEPRRLCVTPYLLKRLRTRSARAVDSIEALEPIKGYLFVRAGHPLAAANVSLRDVLDCPLVQVSRLPPRGQGDHKPAAWLGARPLDSVSDRENPASPGLHSPARSRRPSGRWARTGRRTDARIRPRAARRPDWQGSWQGLRPSARALARVRAGSHRSCGHPVSPHCAGIVTSGSLSLPPVSASVKKKITAVNARFAAQSEASTQNQWSRYWTAA